MKILTVRNSIVLSSWLNRCSIVRWKENWTDIVNTRRPFQQGPESLDQPICANSQSNAVIFDQLLARYEFSSLNRPFYCSVLCFTRHRLLCNERGGRTVDVQFFTPFPNRKWKSLFGAMTVRSVGNRIRISENLLWTLSEWFRFHARRVHPNKVERVLIRLCQAFWSETIFEASFDK